MLSIHKCSYQYMGACGSRKGLLHGIGNLHWFLHNGCLGYNTDDYEALAFKCSSIVNLWCFVRGHYQIRGCPNINLRTVNSISFFRCWNVLLIKAIISTCFDTMDGFMY